MEGEQALRVKSSRSRITQVRIGFFLNNTNFQSFLALAYWRLATLPCAAVLFG